jgi:hypothetical protein
VNKVVTNFKQMKRNYLEVDPEIKDISEEPDEFQAISYEEALYKFYIYCTSPEIVNPMSLCKAHFLGTLVIYYQDIKNMEMHYLLPLICCIKQNKLQTIGSQMILEYLRPKCITNHYIADKITNILQSI